MRIMKAHCCLLVFAHPSRVRLVPTGAVDDVRPAQVFAGFSLAVVVGATSVVAGGQALGNYLSEDGNGAVLERALLFGTILENVQVGQVMHMHHMHTHTHICICTTGGVR